MITNNFPPTATTSLKWVAHLLSFALIALATVGLVNTIRGGGNIFLGVLLNVGGWLLYRFFYRGPFAWLSAPRPLYPTSSPERQTALTLLNTLLTLLGALILISVAETFDPQGFYIFLSIGALPLIAIENWVFWALLLGVTDRLPPGWRGLWDRSAAESTRFNERDLRMLIFSIIGLVIGGGITFLQNRSGQGTDALSGLVVGIVLMDFFVLGAVFWAFKRGGVLGGLFLLAFWTFFGTLSIATQFAHDLGEFFQWLVHRI